MCANSFLNFPKVPAIFFAILLRPWPNPTFTWGRHSLSVFSISLCHQSFYLPYPVYTCQPSHTPSLQLFEKKKRFCVKKRWQATLFVFQYVGRVVIAAICVFKWPYRHLSVITLRAVLTFVSSLSLFLLNLWGYEEIKKGWTDPQ